MAATGHTEQNKKPFEETSLAVKNATGFASAALQLTPDERAQAPSVQAMYTQNLRSHDMIRCVERLYALEKLRLLVDNAYDRDSKTDTILDLKHDQPKELIWRLTEFESDEELDKYINDLSTVTASENCVPERRVFLMSQLFISLLATEPDPSFKHSSTEVKAGIAAIPGLLKMLDSKVAKDIAAAEEKDEHLKNKPYSLTQTLEKKGWFDTRDDTLKKADDWRDTVEGFVGKLVQGTKRLLARAASWIPGLKDMDWVETSLNSKESTIAQFETPDSILIASASLVNKQLKEALEKPDGNTASMMTPERATSLMNWLQDQAKALGADGALRDKDTTSQSLIDLASAQQELIKAHTEPARH